LRRQKKARREDPIMNEVPIAIPVIVYAWVRTFGRVKSANAAKSHRADGSVPGNRARGSGREYFGERATDATMAKSAEPCDQHGFAPQRSLAHPSGIWKDALGERVNPESHAASAAMLPGTAPHKREDRHMRKMPRVAARKSNSR